MFSLLVVDDEELICLGLKAMIESFGDPRIAAISVAFDGDEALIAIRDDRPDIVITDIRMIGMSGLELIREAGRFGYDMRFILLSGYDDFNYAREGIRLGVMNYLLKPASAGEIRDAVDAAMGSLERDWRRSAGTQESAAGAIVESNLNKLISGTLPGGARAGQPVEELRQAFPWQYFMLGMFRLESGGAPGLDPEAFIKAFCTVNASVAIPLFSAYSLINTQNSAMVLFNFAEPGMAGDARGFMAAVHKELSGITRNACSGVLSGTLPGIENIPELHRQCGESLRYRIVRGCGDVIDYGTLAASHDDSRSSGILTDCAVYLDTVGESRDAFSAWIDETFCAQALNDLPIGVVQKLYQMALHSGIRAAGASFFSGGISYREFDSFLSLRDIGDYLKQAARRPAPNHGAFPSEKTNIDVAKRYVKENLGKDLSLTVVANVVSMTYSYFSRIFKRQTGMNLSDYVLMLRMEEAKRLLEDPRYKVIEISKRIGYGNPKHFTRAFKEFTGLSPRDYKNTFRKPWNT